MVNILHFIPHTSSDHPEFERDAPNCWSPHIYIILQALRALPSNISSGALPSPSGNQSTFDLIPAGQMGLTESQLPGQPIRTGNNATTTGAKADINKLNGTVFNGGKATNGEAWAMTLQRELANRYFASAFCSWRATGGSIPGVVSKVSDAELNVTGSIGNTGHVSLFFWCGFVFFCDSTHVLFDYDRCLKSSPSSKLTRQVVVESTPSRWISRFLFPQELQY
jgi:hypothetical protein